MKKVFIKYNPYKLETEIKIDGKVPAQNSLLTEKAAQGNRLQEWIEELPEILKNEYNDDEFEITFHGIMQDYDDIAEIFQKAMDSDLLSYVKLDRIPAKETADKEKLIDDVFKEIIKGPFEELRSEDIKNSFSHAQSEDFEVCVVATMSAGKSTLINSMLGTKLMPSKQEACTAIITRIKDTDSKEWQAKVYNKDEHLIESHNSLTLETMNRLNSDENVSTITVNGDIPFVQSDDVSLILIDTPGPNNSRDPEHGKVQRKFLNSSSKSLVLYIMTGTFGNDDDDTLLKRVAESMKVDGKQSKDRFIFVVNKMDDRRKEDGKTEDTLKRVKDYLKNYGINNPNLFPAAALPALNIQLMRSSSSELDEDTIDETEFFVKKLNKNEHLHFEDFAPLPLSVRGQIKDQLKEAEEKNDKEQQALIHTGIPSIEAAIRQYVLKYAKTAKIKNIVDTFIGRLDAAGSMENTKKEVIQNQEQAEKIVAQINSIQAKINDIKNAHSFEDRVDDAIIEVKEKTEECIENKISEFQGRIYKQTEKLSGYELDVDEASDEVQRLEKFARKIENEFVSDLSEIIQENLVSTSESLIEEYKRKLISLASEINLGNINISISPFDIMRGSFDNSEFNVSNHIHSKKVEDGQEWVKNTDKKWYRPWTWFQESGYYRTKYKTVKYVDGSEIAASFFEPIENALYETGESANKHALKESKQIVAYYKKQFEQLDNVLFNKLDEIKKCATDKEDAEKRLRESEEKFEWLKYIKNKVESILEI